MTSDNPVRSAMEADEVVFGAGAATMSEEMIEVYGNIGLDYVWLDLEHNGPSPYDSETLKNYVRTADSVGTNLLVRIPGTDPHMIRKVFDTGVRNIVVPRVETAEEVERAVRASRFTFAGEPGDRGSSMSRANDWGGDMEAYDRREDEAVSVGAMVENATALGNLDDILSVPELGVVRVGSGDLSVSLGRPFERSHPEVEGGEERVLERAIEHDVPMGGVFGDPDAIREAIDAGYQQITIGDDISTVRAVVGDRYEAVRDY